MDPIHTHSTAACALVEQLVALAESIAGGPLPTLHERAIDSRLETKLRDTAGPLCAQLLRTLAGPEAYIQGTPNFRIHCPFDSHSVIPFHSDVLYGHSPDEINYWINLTPAFDTNSLWMASAVQTEQLHRALKYERLSLEQFEALARSTARPIRAPAPGVYTFCCGQVHGSVLNETNSTRVSIDLRVLGPGGRANVKRRGGYFRPQWLPECGCPLPTGTAVTTVASLDEPTPVYLQRVAMERFYPQGAHRELVEFHGLPLHSPTLTDALSRGPVLAYSVRQLRGLPGLLYPLGFADERVWITPDRTDILERLMREVQGGDLPRLPEVPLTSTTHGLSNGHTPREVVEPVPGAAAATLPRP